MQTGKRSRFLREKEALKDERPRSRCPSCSWPLLPPDVAAFGCLSLDPLEILPRFLCVFSMTHPIPGSSSSQPKGTSVSYHQIALPATRGHGNGTWGPGPKLALLRPLLASQKPRHLQEPFSPFPARAFVSGSLLGAPSEQLLGARCLQVWYTCLLLTPKFPASHLTLSLTVILPLAPAELGLIYISLTNLI